MPRKDCKKGSLNLKSNVANSDSSNTHTYYFDLLQRWLQETIGLNADSISTSALEYSFQQRMKSHQLETLSSYYTQLLTDPAEPEKLIQSIVIPETWFFRDPGAFTALSEHLRSHWLPLQQPLRIASIPCSTGEEPYSITIQLLETGLTAEQFKIHAFDISPLAIAQAQRGLYRHNSFRMDKPDFQHRYFNEVSPGVYQLHENIRQLVTFQRANIITESHLLQPPGYHYIFCRNLLIYFDAEAQRHTLALFQQLLHPQGLLFLGYAETSLAYRHGFYHAPYPKAFAFTPINPHQSQSSQLSSQSPPAPKKNQRRPRASVPHPAPVQPSRPVRSIQTQTSTSPSDVHRPATLTDIQAWANQGRLTEALAACQAYLLKTGEPSIEAHFLCGTLYLALHQPEEAQIAFRKVIYLDPNHYEALCCLAALAKKQGDAQMATLLQERANRVQQRLTRS